MNGIELAPDRPVADLVDQALAAERAGFDTAFVSHHYNNRDQFGALSAMAAATDSIRLGPGVANPYETHPVTLASRMATLDEYSGGRGVFGIGPGDASTLANLGIDRERPLRRVLESLGVARELWDGETVTHDGTFAASDASLNYDVGSIPVYVGAQGPHMVRMAAKHADGVLFNGAHPRDYEWASERVSEGLAERSDGDAASGDGDGDGDESGHGDDGGVDDDDGDDDSDDGDEFDFAAYAPVSVASDAEAARAEARYPVAFVVGSAPDAVLDRHDVDRESARAVGEAVSAGEFSAAADRVTGAMLSAFAIAGTPSEVEKQIDEVLEYADSFVAASPLGPDLGEAIALLGAVIADSRR